MKDQSGAATVGRVRIALDAMGGDNAPHSTIMGAAKALERAPDIELHLFGRENEIKPLLAKAGEALRKSAVIHHTEGVIAMGEKPSAALKKAHDTSMRRAIESVGKGESDVVISAGNTGALMAISKFILKTYPGIDRPAMATLMPTLKGECVLLDLGANVSCDANNLFQFALLGQGFARAVLGVERPRIALLNVGSEEIKGSEEEREAAQLLKNSPLDLNFIGFVEGHDIAEGTAEVIVTDGFSGNISLKTAEGFTKLFESLIREAFSSSISARLGYMLARKSLAKTRERFAARGGRAALFLGLNGIVVKSHGGSDERAIMSGILTAEALARFDLSKSIADEIQASSLVVPKPVCAGESQ